MASPVASNASSPRRLLRRFRRSRKASAAVEFALVAPMFFALLFAIIESGIMFLAGQVLESVNQDSARKILTGQAQNSAWTKAQFANYVCPTSSGTPTLAMVLFNCSNLYIDVQSYSSFTSLSNVGCPIDGSGNFNSATQYNPGNAGDIVVVRMFYQWPLFVTRLGYNPANLSNGNRLLCATAAFKNEPY